MDKATRTYLLADSVFANAVGSADRVTNGEAPPTVTTPWVEILIAGNISISGDGVAWSPLIQVNACAPKGYADARTVVWNLAARAAWVLGRARNVVYLNSQYSGRHTDGPLTDVDTSRGDSTPIVRAIVRAELRVQTT
jgi:hypothetical protein